MLTLIFIITISIINTSNCGLIHHSDKATSYQSFNLVHHHSVPTYIKKEHKQLLEHPVPIGVSQSQVEVHHGDKHDPGYAYTQFKNDQNVQQQQEYYVPEEHGELNLQAHYGQQYETPVVEEHNQQLSGGEEAYQQGIQGGAEQYGHQYFELANEALAQAYQH